jgi:hypothetical protein
MNTRIAPELMMLLKDLNVDKFPHLHGSAQDHLVGVYEILADWGNTEDICRAGLFHNIYGTEVFKPQAVSLTQREAIARVIGARAEELAYLFCVTRRIGFFDDHADPQRAVLWDEVHKRKIVVDAAAVAALMEIEIANGIEQFSPDLRLSAADVRQLLSMSEWMRKQSAGRVSAGAHEDLSAVIDYMRGALAA